MPRATAGGRLPPTEHQVPPPLQDRPKRLFTATQPDQLWVADVTYLPTWEGWPFLAAVIDAFNRRCVGWSMRATCRPSS